MSEHSIQSLGGMARAESLQPKERSLIAKKAAMARWSHPKAAYNGVLDFGELKVVCAVLDDRQTRVIAERSFAYALGARGGASHWRKRKSEEKGALLPEYISRKSLEPFITPELRVKLMNPILYSTRTGQTARGLDASLLGEICDVWVRAREKGALTKKQEETAERAYILMKGFMHVGIVALIDEATGFQSDRAKNALAEILEAFISKELCKWARTFPNDYYQNLFRLRGLTYDQFSNKRPVLIGKDTNDIVYSRLAPGVLDELKRITPRDQKGRTKHRYFQHLTPDLGHPKLREHLSAVVALMKVSQTWKKFKAMIDHALPRHDLPPEFPGMENVPYDVELED